MDANKDLVSSPQAEMLLEELGLDWRLEEVPFSRIDMERSLRNQARITAVLEDRVLQYQNALEAGAVFPAILTGHRGNGRLVTADGNQRSLAHQKAGRESIWAYVFSYDDESEFRALADVANARLNGADNTLEERLMHASYHVDNGVDMQRATVLFGVTRTALKNYRSAMRARERLSVLKVPGSLYRDASDYALSSLHNVLTDEALPVALKLLREGVSVSEIVRAGRTERVVASHSQKVELQMQALADLKEAHTKSTASDLVKPKRGGGHKDTTTMRLAGAIKVIDEALAAPRPEYTPFLAEIKRRVC